MLGHKLVQVLATDADVWATVHSDAESLARPGIIEPSRIIPNTEASDVNSIKSAIDKAEPDVVINAIGIVKQLPTANDVISALSINSIFPHQLARLSGEMGFRGITISTDCVFDGRKGNYSEGDVPDAADLYGKSKQLGEVDAPNFLTLRTSIIGRELGTAHGLVEWFLSNRGGAVKGFTKAVFSGFPTIILAELIGKLIREHPDLRGIYNVSADPIDKYRLLTLLNDAYRANVEITPSDELVIDRSLDSARFREATGFRPAPWPEMIERMAADTTPYGNF